MFQYQYRLLYLLLVLLLCIQFTVQECSIDNEDNAFECHDQQETSNVCWELVYNANMKKIGKYVFDNCSPKVITDITNYYQRKYILIKSVPPHKATNRQYNLETDTLYFGLNAGPNLPEWKEIIVERAELKRLDYAEGRPVLKILEVLILHNTHINYVDPKYFNNFQSLKVLVLSNNKLTKATFTLPPNLEYLSIRGNNIKNIDDLFLNQNTKLKQLDVSENPIKQIDFVKLYKINSHLPKLFRLDSIPCDAIEHNQFQSVSGKQNVDCESKIWTGEQCSQTVTQIQINDTYKYEIILNEIPLASYYEETKWWIIKENGINCLDYNHIIDNIKFKDDTTVIDKAMEQLGGEVMLFHIQSLIQYIGSVTSNEQPPSFENEKEQETYQKTNEILRDLEYKLRLYRAILSEQIDWQDTLSV